MELERTNDILVKENHQLVKAVESYEVELDSVQKKKEMVQQELDQTLQALNEI
jgi:flagellar basal body rod protein FlgC